MREKDFYKFLRSEQLGETEKGAIKKRLLEFVKLNPVRIDNLIRLNNRQSLILRPMPIFLAIALLVSGGTVYAAESTLPGDVLYPVKVEISENVRGWFKFSAEGKAEWDAERVEKRLEEAEILAAEGKLDEEITARVESWLNSHTERMNARIVKLEEDGKIEVAARLNSRLASSLEIHEQILLNLRDRLGDVDFEPLLENMRLRLENASGTRAEIKIRTEAESETGRETAAERLGLAVKSHLERVTTLFEDKKSGLEAETVARIETQLGQANQEYNEGERLFVAGEFAAAFDAYLQANRTLVHISALIHANTDLPVRLHLETREEMHSDIRERIQLRLEEKSELKIDDSEDSDDDSDESENKSDRTIIQTPSIRSETYLEVNANSGGNEIRSRAILEIE